MFFGFLTFIIGGLLAYGLDYGTTKVKCYDRFSNEIIGEKCIQKIGIDQGVGIVIVFLMMGIGIGFMGRMMNNLDEQRERLYR